MPRFLVQEQASDSKQLVIATNSAHDVTQLGAGGSGLWEGLVGSRRITQTNDTVSKTHLSHEKPPPPQRLSLTETTDSATETLAGGRLLPTSASRHLFSFCFSLSSVTVATSRDVEQFLFWCVAVYATFVDMKDVVGFVSFIPKIT